MIRWWTLLSSPVLNFWQLWSSTQYVSKTPSVILYNVIWLTSHIVYPFNQHFFPRNNLTLTRQMSRFDYTQRYMFETARQCWRLSSSNIREHSSHFFQVFNENSLVITSQITFKGSFSLSVSAYLFLIMWKYLWNLENVLFLHSFKNEDGYPW